MCTYALLDEGATVTLIDATVAQQIGATGRLAPISVQGLMNMATTVPDSRRVTFEISGLRERGTYNISGARTIRNLSLPFQTVSEQGLMKHRHLKNIHIEYYTAAEPKIIIGQDH